MTGAYLRVKRDGKYHNIEVEHLTDDERETAIGEEDRIKCLYFLCNFVKDDLLGAYRDRGG